jgi:transposase
MQINKSDRNDAAGIARIPHTGWFKEVRVKDLDSHAVRALLASRASLVKIKRDLENHIRGLLKNLGLIIGRAKFNVFSARTRKLCARGILCCGIGRPRTQGELLRPVELAGVPQHGLRVHARASSQPNCIFLQVC